MKFFFFLSYACSIHNGRCLYYETDAITSPSTRSKRDGTRPSEIDYIWNKLHTAGHWTSWGPWICDAICGRGAFFRKRLCVPSDDFGLPVCKGTTIERSQEECKVKCPGLSEIRRKFIGPKLTDAEMNAHVKLLMSSHGAFQKSVGGVIQLDCYNLLTAHFLSNYSRSSLYWERNGQKLRYDFNRMTISDYSILAIANLKTTDSGVYTCNMKFTKSLHLTILVFSLIVIGQPYDLQVTANTAIKVKCNSDVIGKLFPGLHVQWVVNKGGHVLKDYDTRSPETINEDIITQFSENDTGLWVCVIRDRPSNRTWLTNAFYVKVVPSAFVLFCRRIFQHIDLKWLLLLIAILIILAIIVIFFILRTKRDRNQKLLQRLNDILKISAEIDAEFGEDKKVTEEELTSGIAKAPKAIVKTKLKSRLKAKRKARSLQEKISSVQRKITSDKRGIKSLKAVIDQHDMTSGSIARVRSKNGPKMRRKKASELTETAKRVQIKRRPLTLVSSNSSMDEFSDTSEASGSESCVALGRRVAARRHIYFENNIYGSVSQTPDISESDSGEKRDA